MLPLILIALWLSPSSDTGSNPPYEVVSAPSTVWIELATAPAKGYVLEMTGNEDASGTDGPICIPFIGCF
ncbi:MAG: hypothetical protein ABJF88_17850 [Rhodothermales bacterium]|uniref:hypothetical protein n=1 Tax=Roseibium sp. TaxID=1936156 RepID=UPI0032792064